MTSVNTAKFENLKISRNNTNYDSRVVLKIQQKLFGGWSGIIITMSLFLIVTSAAEAGFLILSSDLLTNQHQELK